MTNQPSDLGRAVDEVVEKTQFLVREEIELAKAEITVKAKKLAMGAAVGAVAGVFALVGLLFVLDAAAWGVWDLVDDGDNYWLGFLIVAVVLFVVGGIAGFVASRLIKKGTPPTPQMAIEEAQKIKETYSTPGPAHRTQEAHR